MELQRRHSSLNKIISGVSRALSAHLNNDDLAPLDGLAPLDQKISQALSTESKHWDTVPLNNSLSSILPASYWMSRSVNTVTDLWREFSVELGGGPSIQSLEENHKSGWRRSDAERKYFKRRKVIIDEILKIAGERNIDMDEAVVILERFRLSLRNNSLDSLRKELIK